MTIKKLEARLSEGRLKVYDVDEFKRRYLGFVALHLKDFTLCDLKYSALLLYSKKNPLMQRVPKFEIKIIYGDNNKSIF